MTDRWLPDGFVHPQRVDIVDGVHIRPIRASDVDLDMVTVMANRDALWAMYGAAWGWPEPDMTREHDEADLARHAAEMVTQESFNYAVFDAAESRPLGCIYIDPLDPDAGAGPAAEVSWWLGRDTPDEVRAAVDAFVPRWIDEVWPFTAVDYPFQDLWPR